MKLGVLCSGGKDSLYACFLAMQKEEVACLITLFPENPESYMFHTPNLHMVPLQAEAAGLPLVSVRTEGIEEKELSDLTRALESAVNDHEIEGVVTGALMSVYQSSRIQRICHALGLWCFNPLWYTDPARYMENLRVSGFRVVISGVFSEPFDESWLGRELDGDATMLLSEYAQHYGITLTGEGGEYETLVLDAPFFRKKIAIQESEKKYCNFRGVLNVKRASLEEK
ncbi:MAG: diphthine--ammonia ligase [Methanolinea sp.]|jgi:ABC transporter with metal-binding/Fe-S-binding domain ATP-binding protein|nr:diphthine--ammonia ligase [Methanolinea sp.]